MLNLRRKLFNKSKILNIFTVCTFFVFFEAHASKLIDDQNLTSQHHVPSIYFSQLGSFSELPRELIHEIFSYCSQEATVINHAFFTIITGYTAENVFKRGIETPPLYNAYTFPSYKVVNFKNPSHQPGNIPSYIWYKKVSSVEHIPKFYWPFLKDTQVHSIDLGDNNIEDEDIEIFSQSLLRTKVNTVILNGNNIGGKGLRTLVRILPYTQVHTIDLSDNNIKDEDMETLVEALSNTKLHTIYFKDNTIGFKGFKCLIQNLVNMKVDKIFLSGNNVGVGNPEKLSLELQNMQLKILDLSFNKIDDKTLISLTQALPGSKLSILDLSYNRIGLEGLKNLGGVLPKTQINKINLKGNNINIKTQEYFRKQFSFIEWIF